MRFQKSLTSLLIIAIFSSCIFVRADDSEQRTQQDRTKSKALNSEPANHKAAQIHNHRSSDSEKNRRAPLVEKYLLEGKLESGESALISRLKDHPGDDQARFGLGILQFLHSVERLMQDFYRYGLRNSIDESSPETQAQESGRAGAAKSARADNQSEAQAQSQANRAAAPGKGSNQPRRRRRSAESRFFRLPLPVNPSPETLSYVKARKIAETFLDNLSKADATLSQITDADVKVPLHFGLIRLDFKGDGRANENESLWKIYAALNRTMNVSEEKASGFLICFDRGDVHWLRGYCNLLMSLCDIYLAHDTREWFECAGHLLFKKIETPYDFLSRGKRVFDFHDFDVADLIAAIHLIHWQVIEPERMATSLHHLETMAAQSKESWKWILAETDDDHEWIPNPRQSCVIPNVRVNQQMVDSWLDLMDQAEKVLQGKLLIPFWRDGRGINLKRVFMEPRTLDLVLWVQGPAAAPYLEDGPRIKYETWDRLKRVFGGEFIGFAFWFN